MPKKIKNVFESAITYSKMYKAYIFAKRCKRYRHDVIKFSLRVEDYTQSICYELENGIYKFGKYKEFYVYEPKKRRILAASFRDRIVHTWYVQNFIEPIFIPQFISTSYACIKGQGVHKCTLDVKAAIYKLSRKWKSAYIIKMDVAKYFQNVDKNILMDIISKKISDKKFLEFTEKLLLSSSVYDEVAGVSLPIGNYTSQMFGNIYLNEVDQYAKHVLKCKYYFRYLDDTCIICETKEKAQGVLSKITLFYEEVLHLKLNSKTNIFKISQGINFCGYKIKIGRMRIKEKGKRKLIKKLKLVRLGIKSGDISICDAKRMVAGHVGYISRANVDKLIDKLFYLKE